MLVMLNSQSRQFTSMAIVLFMSGCLGFDGTPVKPPPALTTVAVSATAPELIYSNVKEIVMDARRSALINGRREIFYHWVCAQYPGTVLPKIDSATAAYTTVSGFEIGNYVFRLRVFDKNGNEAFDDFPLEVRKDTLVGPPQIIPMPDGTINLPQDQIIISSTDHVIGNYYNRVFIFDWSVLQQPPGSQEVLLKNKSNASLLAEGLSLGSYSFRMEVTNELGLKASDTVDVLVRSDTLAGTTKVYENIDWLDISNAGTQYALIVQEPGFIYRTRDMIEIRVWDPVKKEWIDSDKYLWSLAYSEIRVTAYSFELQLEGVRTNVEVKFK